ncbi:MAG: hypothetical protein P8168_03530 [Deltaproteobacteria bacterium]
MDYKNWLVPIVDGAVEKSLKALGKEDQEIEMVRTEIENAVLKDTELNTKLDDLISEKLKTLDTGPLSALRAAVRPVVTIILALVFGFLIVFPFVWDLNPSTVNWDKIFAAFMGVFGTIIGFWFGERSALKVPGAEPKAISKPTPTVPATPAVKAAEAPAAPKAAAEGGTKEGAETGN